jgi:FADH2-dependent halogenase
MKWGLDYINPDLARRMVGAVQTEPVRSATNYSYDLRPYAGEGWLCIGDAHRFMDPIFSFGVSLSMLEARAGARAILRILRGSDEREQLAAYCAYCDAGQDVALDVIRYFWKFPIFFGYQMRGRFRKDIIRLLGSDLHAPGEVGAVEIIREQLRTAARSAPMES